MGVNTEGIAYNKLLTCNKTAELRYLGTVSYKFKTR
jgi:hypothetical protein